VVLSKNPVHSVLFLILLFFESAIILIFFHIEFLSLLLIIIYVGAIAVLFLFVIMMLQIKVEPFKFSILTLLSFILGLFVFCELLFLQNQFFWFFDTIFDYYFLVDSMDSLLDVSTLGQVLFNYYSLFFLIAGLLLLVALVGVIVLLVDVNRSAQTSVVFRRLSRTDNFLSCNR